VHHGLVPGAVTGISLKNEIDHLVSAMALLCLKAPHVNLPSYETEVSKRTIAQRLSVTQVIAEKTDEWMEGCRIISAPDLGQKLEPFAQASALPNGACSDATVLYRTTSGSTNVPKTFEVSLNYLLLAAQQHATDPGQCRVLRTSSMEFDSSRFHRICALIAGNACIFSPEINLATLGEFCGRAEVSGVHIGTYKLASLVDAQAHDVQRLPSFTRVLTGGSRVSGTLRRQIKEVLTDNLWVHYAASEVGPISVARPEEHEAYPEGVGFPLPGVTIKIVNSKGGILGPGEIGRARIRKLAIPNQYVDDPVASASFRDGWFDPGDLLSQTKCGSLILHGRVDDVMILNGINIFPSAIEDTLESHPDVREAVAFGVRSRIHGEIPVAAVVLSESAQNRNVAHLLDHCREYLGVRRPREIFIVDHIPRTHSGKPLRRELSLR
jgi:long-chain acyl-CoA synthetase